MLKLLLDGHGIELTMNGLVWTTWAKRSESMESRSVSHFSCCGQSSTNLSPDTILCRTLMIQSITFQTMRITKAPRLTWIVNCSELRWHNVLGLPWKYTYILHACSRSRRSTTTIDRLTILNCTETHPPDGSILILTACVCPDRATTQVPVTSLCVQ